MALRIPSAPIGEGISIKRLVTLTPFREATRKLRRFLSPYSEPAVDQQQVGNGHGRHGLEHRVNARNGGDIMASADGNGRGLAVRGDGLLLL